jgi:hypothetical protein
MSWETPLGLYSMPMQSKHDAKYGQIKGMSFPAVGRALYLPRHGSPEKRFTPPEFSFETRTPSYHILQWS